MRGAWCRLGWLLIVALLVGCGPSTPSTNQAAQPPWFEDATNELGLDFVNDPGPEGSHFMPQSMGNGAALLDYDQDGRLDIYLLHGAGPGSKSKNRLYHQEPSGGFRDVSQGSGLDVAGFGSGVAVGDVNNDGRPDVFLSEYGGLRLFVNEGEGKFRDVTAASGLSSLLWGVSSSFLDFDRDGWLDLVVVNYVAYDSTRLCYARDGTRDFCTPTQFAGSVTKLYRNITDTASDPRFDDVTESSGLGDVPGPGLGVLCADFNGDDWDDIFVANDQQPNRLWINQQNGTFRDEAQLRGVAVNRLGSPEANMGTAWGDVDGDGLNDLFVTHLDTETHTLWKQHPRGLFMDRTADAGLVGIERSTGFGAVLADFDLDGDLDLAYVNGRVFKGDAVKAPGVSPFWSRYAQPNSLLQNDGRGRFTSIADSNPAFCQDANVARALCCGDLDNDGDLDLLVATTARSARLLRNHAPRAGHWLLVEAAQKSEVRGQKSEVRVAYGALVTVTAGERRWQRLVNPGSSYLSSHDPRAHFGLGAADKLDRIEVRWPDGANETFPGGAADRIVQLRRGEGSTP